jgi:PAS domain S-box-containing protein
MPIPLRLLMLEHSPPDAEFIVHELTRAGFEPDWTRVETEGEFLAALGPSIDLVLAEYALPEYDGLTALRAMRERGFDIPLVIVSGATGEDVAVSAIKGGAADYLVKGRLARLGVAVSQALEHRDLQRKARAAEDSLRESEELYRSLFGNMLNGFAYCRMLFEHGKPQDFIYLAVNLAFESQTGLKDVVGRRVSEVIPGIRESDPQLFEIYGRVAMTGQPEHFETFVEALQMWFSISVYSPGREHFVAVFDVVSERKRTEEALRESEERYRLLVDESPYAIAVHQDGALVFVNPAALSLLGAERADELIGRPVSSIVHSAGWEAAQERIGRMLQGETGLYPVGDRYVRLDGSEVHVEVSAAPFTFGGGPAIQVIALDITERTFARERLRESEELFRATFEQAAVGIAHVAPDGRWLRVNQRLCDIVGYSREELLRKSFQDITDPADTESNVEALRRLLEGEIRTYSDEKRYVRKDGSFVWVALTVSLVRTKSGDPDYLISVIEDITERKGLEAQFLQAQKMESVGQLAGGIAHDFNNLLNVITGMAFFVSEQLKADDPLQEDLREITRAADRAAAMTRQLLAFSRKQIMEPKVLDVGRLVLDLAGMLGRLIGEDVELAVVPARGSCSIRADPGQIEQAVMNLAVNARDAMPNGGTLTIETQAVELAGTQAATYPSLEPGAYVQLTVSDSGDGMDEATRARIFEPFFTTKEVGKGTGLGLSTVYGIVQQSGGTIWVDSEVGQGTSFRIWFPEVEEAAPGDEPAPAIAPERGAETILVVEDYVGLRQLARRMLEKAGYTVLVASDGGEALQALERHDSPVHLLLTDVVMPGMNGRELAARMREAHPEVKVIYTSGHTEDALIRHGIEADAAHFLRKPYTHEDLTRAVRVVLDAG